MKLPDWDLEETMLVVSFLLAVGSALAIAIGITKHTDYNPMLHVFMTCASLYSVRKNGMFMPSGSTGPTLVPPPTTPTVSTPSSQPPTGSVPSRTITPQ